MTLEPRRLYGFFLACTHIVTLIFWRAFDPNFGLLDKLQHLHGNNWSFLPTAYPDFVQRYAGVFYWSYVILALVSPWPFLIKRVPFRNTLILFVAAFLAKVSIYLSTYDFMGNYQYMNNLVMLAFVFTAGRLFLVQVMMALFYFGAGLIKLNWEWISGEALIRQTFISGPLLIAACVYVIFLELIFVWGLFAKKAWIKYGVLLQLVAFHLFSWHIVGFYYPVVMLLLLSVFVIYDTGERKLTPWSYIYIAIFLLAQFYPKVLNKNESVTAEGRTFSLNMLDARTECLGSYEIKKEDGYIYLDQPVKLSVRVRCDPLVFFNYGKRLCQELSEEQKTTVVLNLKTRKATEEKMTWTVRELPLCSNKVTYSVFMNNWVYSSNEDIKKSEPMTAEPVNTKHWRENPQRTGEGPEHINLNAPAFVQTMPLSSGIHSAAKSSPVGFDDLWVVGGDDGHLWGFAGSKKIWNSYFPEPNYGFHGSAAISDEDLIIGSYDGVLHKIALQTGKRKWAAKLGMAIGSSPLVLDNALIVAAEDFSDVSQLYNLDPRDGEPRWRVTVPGLAHSSPAFNAALKVLYFGTNAGKLLALNLDSGSQAWEHTLPGKVISTPVVGKDAVYAITTDGILVAFNPKLGQELWRKQLTGTRASPSLSTISDILIVGLEDGSIRGLRAKSGEEVWQITRPHLHVSSGLLTLSSDGKSQIYWDLCAEKTLCAIMPTTGKVVREYLLPGNFSSTPTALNGRLIVTLENDLGIWILGERP